MYVAFLKCLADVWHLQILIVPNVLCYASNPSFILEAFFEYWIPSTLVMKFKLLWKTNKPRNNIL